MSDEVGGGQESVFIKVASDIGAKNVFHKLIEYTCEGDIYIYLPPFLHLYILNYQNGICSLISSHIPFLTPYFNPT